VEGVMKLMIGTPSYAGEFCAPYVMSIAATVGDLAARGIATSLCIASGNPFVDLARNEIVVKFLKSDADQLLFVDDDVGFDYNAVPRMLSCTQEIVAGLVPKRNATKEDEFHQNAITGVMEGGLMQAFEAPTAFMLIKRGILERMLERFPDISEAGRDPLFFHSGTRRDSWGEDIYFCRKVVEMGEHLWIDADINFTHTGKKVWRGNFYDHAVKSGMLQTAELSAA